MCETHFGTPQGRGVKEFFIWGDPIILFVQVMIWKFKIDTKNDGLENAFPFKPRLFSWRGSHPNQLMHLHPEKLTWQWKKHNHLKMYISYKNGDFPASRGSFPGVNLVTIFHLPTHPVLYLHMPLPPQVMTVLSGRARPDGARQPWLKNWCSVCWLSMTTVAVFKL